MFMVIAEFLSLSDLSEVLFFPFRFISWAFRVPGETVSVIILSLLGGYPTGADVYKRQLQVGGVHYVAAFAFEKAKVVVCQHFRRG